MCQKFVRKYHEKNTASYRELTTFSLHIWRTKQTFSVDVHIHAFGNCNNFGGKNTCALRLSAKSHLRELIEPAIFRHGGLVTLHFFTSADVSTLGRTCAFAVVYKNRKLLGITDEDLTRMGLVIRLPSLANSSKCSTVLSKYICLSCSRSKMTVSC